jgi:hypothetical protein
MLLLDIIFIYNFIFNCSLHHFKVFIAITKFLSMINVSFDFRVGGICLFMNVVMYILFYMYCLLYL